MADKLSRLLETEIELDAMLDKARKDAANLAASARADAEDRVRRFELELEEENHALRDRVAVERDESIAVIRADAKREVETLDGLGEERIADLARYVVERLVGGGSGGRP